MAAKAAKAANGAVAEATLAAPAATLAAEVAIALAAAAVPVTSSKTSDITVAKGPESPVHHMVMQQKSSSTPKGRKSRTEALNGKVPVGWHIRSVLVQGGLEVIFLTQSDFANDCYGIVEVASFLREKRAKGEFDHPIMKIGLLGQYYMIHSLKNQDRLLEKKGVYQRKCLVRVLDPEEETPIARGKALQVVKAFLQEKQHNQYTTAVHLNQDTFDITPDPMPKLDHYVQFLDIVKILKDLFDGVDSGWAVNNMESALTYLTEGHVPIDACKTIGFPVDSVMENQVGKDSMNPP